MLEGRLSLPGYQSFVSAIGRANTELADKMFIAMWRSYLQDKGTISLPYWADVFNNATVLNLVLMSLAKAGWIETKSIPARNWAEANLLESKLLEYLTLDELESVRARHKYSKYVLNDDVSTATDRTKINGRVTSTGLVREGFAKAGNSRFSYDVDMLEGYLPVVQAQLTKSMDKIRNIYPELRCDKASYDTVSIEILDYHRYHRNAVFTTGNNYSDSRGRAISQATTKVFNPISNKEARALLVINK
jgi:hypothetical protein